MKIALHGKSFLEETVPYILDLFNELTSREVTLFVSDEFNAILEAGGLKKLKIHQVYKDTSDLSGIDFFISVGGDGTLLETITHVGVLETPILGINTGRMGFLATTPKDKIGHAIEALMKSEFTIDERALIKLETEKKIFKGLNFALNEFAILKTASSSMITVHTYINDEYLNSYWADGLIVATPTGSTGYSLSCGGPIVMPDCDNFVVTPVSPHNLNIRPLIVSDKSIISFKVESRSKNFLVSLDSRSGTVNTAIKMSVRKEDFKAKLVKLKNHYYIDTLRQKLHWGLDMRN